MIHFERCTGSPNQLIPLRSLKKSRTNQAFTLLELLVTMAVLSIFFVMLLGMTNNTFKLWKTTRGDLQTFENARAAYDIFSKRISEATLNPYLDYYDTSWNRRNPASSTFAPKFYGRATDMDFRVGNSTKVPFSLTTTSQGQAAAFFAPLGYTANNSNYSDLPNLLNPCAYFIEYDNGMDVMPAFLQGGIISPRYRFRLKEIIQPTQDFKSQTSLTDSMVSNDDDWITSLMASASSKHPLAENIILLIIRPEVSSKDVYSPTLPNPWSLTTDYVYKPRDPSKNSGTQQGVQWAQLPPLLRVIMVAVDEKDAARVCTSSTIPNALKVTGFTDPGLLDSDLATLQQQLTNNRISYKVFSTVFPMRSSKWSGN